MVQVCNTKQGTEYYGVTQLSPIIDINTKLFLIPDFGSLSLWEDRSGNLRNGTNFNATRALLHSLFGSHYNFNGTNAYIDLGAAVIGDSATFTLSTWYKSTSTSIAGHRLYAECSLSSGTPMFNLTINDGIIGDVKFGIRDNSGVIGSVNAAAGANDGLWHNIAGVQSSKSLRELYFDGIKIGTNAVTLGAIAVNNSKIGVQNRAGVFERYFSGNIGSVLLYNRALSATEIMTNYVNSPFYYIKT